MISIPKIPLQAMFACIMVVALQGCSWFAKDLVNPDIQVIGLAAIPGGNLLDQRFALRLQLTNPNDMELEVKGISFILSIRDIELLHGVSDEVPLIKPYSTTEFTVKGSVNLIQAVRLLHKMQKKPDERVAYTLKTHFELAHGFPSTFNLTRTGDIGMDDWQDKNR